MKVRLLCLFLCCLAVPLVSHAQQGFYEKGFIIHDGDTLHGFVEKADELDMSHAINFKKYLEETAPAKYAPQALDGFGFTTSGLSFSSVEVDVWVDGEKTTDTRFARNMLSGEASLHKLYLPTKEKAQVFLKNNSHVYIHSST